MLRQWMVNWFVQNAASIFLRLGQRILPSIPRELASIVEEREWFEPSIDRPLIPDKSKTIDEGAVAPWNSLMWSLMTDVCREMGVRTDIPFCELSDREKEIVYDGPMEKRHIFYVPKNKDSASAGELNMTYYSATATVLNALNKVKDDKGMKRVEKFLKEEICPECRGTRLSRRSSSTTIDGHIVSGCLSNDIEGFHSMGQACARCPTERNARYGSEYLRVV